MALSNWDTLAFDENGKASLGVFNAVRNEGDYVEIYKNWLYVHSKRMWKDKRSFVKDTIAEIQSGDVKMLSFDISAVRGPQEAIFVLVKEFVYFEKKKGEKEKPSYYRFFAGIGCSGYDGEEWIGVKPETLKMFFEWLEVQDGSDDDSVRYHVEWVNEIRAGNPEVPLITFEEAKDHCQDKGFQAWVAKCRATTPLRFNQGDMFFAANAGIDLPATKVGESAAPVLSQMIGSMKEKEDGDTSTDASSSD